MREEEGDLYVPMDIFEIRNPKSEIRNPESGIRNPNSEALKMSGISKPDLTIITSMPSNRLCLSCKVRRDGLRPGIER